MKTCSTCHELKPLEAFNIRRSAPDGRQPRCRDCCILWYQAHRAEHKINTMARTKRTRIVYQQRLAEHLAQEACLDCGEDDLRVLEFDHRPGTVKRAAVATLVADLVPWAEIEAEIAKCDVRCCNCHRRRTLERGHFWRHAWYLEREAPAHSSERLARIFDGRMAS